MTRFLILTIAVIAAGIVAPIESRAETKITKPAARFFTNFCIDCHGADGGEAGISLEMDSIDWQDHHSADLWTKVHTVLTAGDMPPADADQPTADERNAIAQWLDQMLTEHVKPGGTVLRRLNRQEYGNTIRNVFRIPFTVPRSFPADTRLHGFDNIGEGLVLSPPLMAQYVEIATVAADSVLPPTGKKAAIQPETIEISPGEFTLNFTTGHEIDGILRMASSCDPLSRGSVWPNRFEAKASGTYDIELELSAFKPTAEYVPEVHLLARNSTGANYQKVSTMQKLAEFQVNNTQSARFRTTAELTKGQTVVIHYENAPICSDNKDNLKYLNRVSKQIRDMFQEDPELGAAWMKAGYQRSDRGWSWWKRIEACRQDADLQVADFDVDSEEVKAFTLEMARRGVNTIETMACFNFFRGPGIDIHRMSITGPTRLIEDEEAKSQRLRMAEFLGERNGRDDRSYAEAILRPVLSKAFRRPLTEQQLTKYVDLVIEHQGKGHRFEDGLHLAIRAGLCSTNFLYREVREGPLDDYDLASRLSYFLTSSPPDDALRKAAAMGKLSDPDVLEQHTRRLLSSNKVKNFLNSFTGQWLDLRLLPEIMPDARLLKWVEKDLAAVTAETEMFVAEILRENHSIETFIDSDFTYLNRRNAKLYDIDFPKSDTMKRVKLARGGRRGGILTQASVLMATANGVDTQPVLRGAWMLENVFGMPTPEPPSNVPAIEPSTTGAKSIRELLERHKADESCASCHLKIDPPGFVLENFDPVGRWRDHYPVYEKREDKVITRKGLPVDAAGVMPDGTELRDVQDMKRYLIQNIDLFSNCLTGKLLTYATGRPPNYGDRKVIAEIVDDVKARGNGFADLVISIVQSESFRAR